MRLKFEWSTCLPREVFENLINKLEMIFSPKIRFYGGVIKTFSIISLLIYYCCNIPFGPLQVMNYMHRHQIVNLQEPRDHD
jgi:hypothetical protein